jgi:hypothetical protein
MADETAHTPPENAPPKIKLNLASPGVPPVQIRPADSKKETTRIDLSQAMPPPPAATVGDTQPVHADDAPAPAPDLPKRSTIRIDIPQAAKTETQKVKTETQKIAPRTMNETMRVEVAEPRKTETTRINIPPEAFEKKPGAAPRAKPPEGAEDIFKRSTIPVGIPTPPPAPAERPKTLSVKRPVPPPAESAPAVIPPDQRAVAEAKKSETARIDLPADAGERPPTRPKTIRIKRPDGTTARKTLTIARPDAESVSTAVRAPSEEESVGVAFSALSLVAVLVICVLIYVLAAQTFAPELPFPGRI